MSRPSWQRHVTIDADLHHGEPCIRGTRVSVRTLIGSLADGMSAAEIIAVYPQLTGENILGALAYAADVLRHEAMVPLSSSAADAHQGR